MISFQQMQLETEKYNQELKDNQDKISSIYERNNK